jgi:sec-independent protein translocase protein TatB
LEFLGVGYQELLLVFVLMLVVVGPERLPQVAYQIGRAVRQMQRYARVVRDEFSDELGFIEEQYQTVRGEVDVARAEFRRQQQELDADVRETAKSIDASVPDELKGRGNVIPISSAPARPAASGAAAAPAANGTPAATPAATPVEAPAVTVEPAATDEPAAPDGKMDKPPLVF